MGDTINNPLLLEGDSLMKFMWWWPLIGSGHWLFFGTGIPAAILIFNKAKEHKDELFIDASKEYQDGKKQNKLRAQDIEHIVTTYQAFESTDKYSFRANLQEIEGNEFNLNIPRYVDTFEEEELVDIQAVQKEIDLLESELVEVRHEKAKLNQPKIDDL